MYNNNIYKMDVKKNPWMVHLKKVIKRNPGKNLKQHLLIAKQSYKKKDKKNRK
jgi:hypothetical protein